MTPPWATIILALGTVWLIAFTITGSWIFWATRDDRKRVRR